jgi:Fe-S cluster assembly iron-binding protein IscA
MGMALDEPKDTDATFAIGGFDFVIDRELLNRTQPIVIDYSPMGFQVTGGTAPGNGNSGCVGGGRTG